MFNSWTNDSDESALFSESFKPFQTKLADLTTSSSTELIWMISSQITWVWFQSSPHWFDPVQEGNKKIKKSFF